LLVGIEYPFSGLSEKQAHALRSAHLARPIEYATQENEIGADCRIARLFLQLDRLLVVTDNDEFPVPAIANESIKRR